MEFGYINTKVKVRQRREARISRIANQLALLYGLPSFYHDAFVLEVVILTRSAIAMQNGDIVGVFS